jgi:hypothetical protein
MIPAASPIESAGDPQAEFDDYFRYLIDQYQPHVQWVAKFEEAKKTLDAQFFDLRALKEISLDDLKKYINSHGITAVLQRWIPKFQRDRA